MIIVSYDMKKKKKKTLGEVSGAGHVYTTILVYGLNPMINVILFAFNPLSRVIRVNHTQMAVTHNTCLLNRLCESFCVTHVLK
jgi:predicted solute-binding protein